MVFISYLQGVIVLKQETIAIIGFGNIVMKFITDAMSSWANPGQQWPTYSFFPEKHGKLYYGFGCGFLGCLFLEFFLVFAMFILKWHTCGVMARCFPMFGCSTSAVASCDLDATAGVGFGTRTRCP